MKVFKITNARLSAGPILQTGDTFRYPGTTPSISANGTSNGMVWAVENTTSATLHAGDAGNLHELYHISNQAGSRDQLGAGKQVHHFHDCEWQSLRGDDE
jgi:hypothetical protein